MKAKKPSRVLIVLLLLCNTCFLTGCLIDTYADKYPKRDPNQVWICDEIQAFFFGLDEETNSHSGLLYSNEVLRIEMAFGYGSKVEIGNYIETPPGGSKNHDEFILINGYAEYYEDYFVMSDLHIDKLFNFRYETLTFRCYDMDEVDWVDGWPVVIE